ncbi:polyadenylate-binding protein 2-like [Mercurialis annua]|uniref:polyadenylate-binding protein 2-like n=1 Tax=Mercurialis annua TaxID=3986 RepID=UPI00215FF993|nr:polyadenylate-binding protein 2-like [Mercurialis annua]
MAQVQAQPQSPVTSAATVAPPSPPNGMASNAVNQNQQQFVSTSLYVGDLDSNANETQLYDLFSQLGQVVSIRVCRDLSSKRSLGYAYVNYTNAHDAAQAMEVLNFTPFNGKPIRIMYSHRDPTIRKSGAGNIYIKNLDKTIDNKALHDTFSTFGNILSCKVVTDASGQSLGYGFVQFDNEDSAKNAIDKLNGMLLNDKQVFVGPFLRKQERESSVDKTRFNNVFVKNLSETTTEEDLKTCFGEYGAITSTVVMRDGNGKSRGFGFVNFESPDDAARSVEGLNGKIVDDKEWFVGKAQKKSERETELRGRFEQNVQETVDKFEGLNLYVKNLDDSITDEKLKELFSEFGTITSCKVMRDPKGVSRGSGFVAFSNAQEASKALTEMNGKMLVGKPLYVALAQRKEERRAKLQAQFAQVRPSGMAPGVGPRMPIYHPGTPGVGHHVFYGQGPPSIVPPQPGFGYQQQLVPGMRPIFVPMMQPGQENQRLGGRRSGAGPMQPQQPHHMMQPQMIPRGHMYRYPPGRSMPDVPMAGHPGSMLPVPYDMAGMPLRDASFSQPMQAGALATSLANASPEQQRMLLGENLYPLVDQLEHENAAKVTGMLLEMDQTEVLHLLESPEALKAKVSEALEVLRNVQKQQQSNTPTDRIASLSLNDS